jgi:hypothetical protein
MRDAAKASLDAARMRVRNKAQSKWWKLQMAGRGQQ